MAKKKQFIMDPKNKTYRLDIIVDFVSGLWGDMIMNMVNRIYDEFISYENMIMNDSEVTWSDAVKYDGHNNEAGDNNTKSIKYRNLMEDINMYISNRRYDTSTFKRNETNGKKCLLDYGTYITIIEFAIAVIDSDISRATKYVRKFCTNKDKRIEFNDRCYEYYKTLYYIRSAFDNLQLSYYKHNGRELFNLIKSISVKSCYEYDDDRHFYVSKDFKDILLEIINNKRRMNGEDPIKNFYNINRESSTIYNEKNNLLNLDNLPLEI